MGNSMVFDTDPNNPHSSTMLQVQFLPSLSRNDSSTTAAERNMGSPKMESESGSQSKIKAGLNTASVPRKHSVRIIDESSSNRSPETKDLKNKFITKIESKLTKLTNVPHEEFLRRKDVTLEEKRTLIVYTRLNVISFLLQTLVVLVLQYIKGFKFLSLESIPISVIKEIFFV